MTAKDTRAMKRLHLIIASVFFFVAVAGYVASNMPLFYGGVIATALVMGIGVIDGFLFGYLFDNTE